jgi:hypothetical protein
MMTAQVLFCSPSPNRAAAVIQNRRKAQTK